MYERLSSGMPIPRVKLGSTPAAITLSTSWPLTVALLIEPPVIRSSAVFVIIVIADLCAGGNTEPKARPRMLSDPISSPTASRPSSVSLNVAERNPNPAAIWPRCVSVTLKVRRCPSTLVVLSSWVSPNRIEFASPVTDIEELVSAEPLMFSDRLIHPAVRLPPKFSSTVSVPKSVMTLITAAAAIPPSKSNVRAE